MKVQQLQPKEITPLVQIIEPKGNQGTIAKVKTLSGAVRYVAID